MGFSKGFRYPHPPRGPARKPYTVSQAARAQRCANLKRTRIRSDRKSLIIKLLIWQSVFDSGPRPSQRTLPRRLRVWSSYVCKVQRQSTRGLEELLRHGRTNFEELEQARRFTAKLREQEPGLLASPAQPQPSSEPRVMTDDEIIADNWRKAREDQRKNLSYGDAKPRTLRDWQELEQRRGRRGGWFRWSRRAVGELVRLGRMRRSIPTSYTCPSLRAPTAGNKWLQLGRFSDSAAIVGTR